MDIKNVFHRLVCIGNTGRWQAKTTKASRGLIQWLICGLHCLRLLTPPLKITSPRKSTSSQVPEFYQESTHFLKIKKNKKKLWSFWFASFTTFFFVTSFSLTQAPGSGSTQDRMSLVLAPLKSLASQAPWVEWRGLCRGAKERFCSSVGKTTGGESEQVIYIIRLKVILCTELKTYTNHWYSQ